jgi:hypothetical protein
MVLVFRFPMGEGEGTGFGGAMLWWGMVVEGIVGGWMLRSDGRINSEAVI